MLIREIRSSQDSLAEFMLESNASIIEATSNFGVQMSSSY